MIVTEGDRVFRSMDPEQELRDDLDKIYACYRRVYGRSSQQKEQYASVDEALYEVFASYTPVRLAVTIGNLQRPGVAAMFHETHGPFDSRDPVFSITNAQAMDTMLDDARDCLEGLLHSYMAS